MQAPCFALADAAGITGYSAAHCFLDIGGFPEVPLMEDVEFFRRLVAPVAWCAARKRIVVSPRRYEESDARADFAYGFIAALCFAGCRNRYSPEFTNATCCAPKEHRISSV